METHSNLVTNIQNAIATGTPLRFAKREFRGITWIEDIARNVPYTFPSRAEYITIELNAYSNIIEIRLHS